VHAVGAGKQAIRHGKAKCLGGFQVDHHHIIECRMADGESLAISVPAGETRVLKHFQARMPYGLVVPGVP
jgi:hypothetical protein